jgi:site-specific DNA-cytosine methylase
MIRCLMNALSSRFRNDSIHRSWQDLAQSAASDHRRVPEALLDAIRQFRVSALPAATNTHSNHSYYQGFVAFIHLNDQYRWHQAMCCIDTLSQINMISPAFLDSIPFPWDYVAPPSSVLGAGGSTSSTKGEVLIGSYSLVYRGQTSPIRCTVIDIPDKIDLVLGLPEIKRLRLAPFLHDYRAYVLAYKETIRLDDLRRIRRRLNSAPWNIMSLCGGIEPQISTLLELGIHIGRYYSIEFSVNARQASTAYYPAIVHLTPHNLVEFSQNNSISQLDHTEIHAIFAGFPCQSLSNNENGSSPDFTIHTAGAAIIDHITEANPNVRKFIENRIPNQRSYRTAVDRLNQLYHNDAQHHEASHSGSPATRPRLYWIRPQVDLSTLPKIQHPNPSWLLGDGFIAKHNPASCILASASTETTNYAVSSDESKSDREYTADERDRFNPGSPSGITNGFGSLDYTNAIRFAGSGNAFNMDELWQILRHWPSSERIHSPRALSTVYDIAFAQAEAVELFYLNMTDAEAWQYMKKLAQNSNLTMPRLWLQLKNVETVPYQTRAPGIPPPRLASSADYCVDELIRDGSHIEVEYSHEYWIALMFFKAKDRTIVATADGIDGTYKQGDELQAVRPLKDDRWINEAIEYPGHWAENSPDRHQFIEDIPIDTEYFRPYDAHNAYHACLLELASRIYTVCTYRNAVRRRFIMPLGASQGLAPVGTFFPSWVNYGYNFFFGQHHSHWWRQFIDDCFAFANSEIRTDNRHRMMSYALSLMGLKSSGKDAQEQQSLPSIDCVGIHWTPKGICLPQASVKYIAELLLIVPKSTTEARRLRGVILQSVSAFQFNLRDMGLFNRLMIPLNDAITEAENSQSKRLKWTPECEQAMIDMSNCFTNQPLAYHDPSWILSDTRCLAQIGDADPLAVTGYLVSVAKADARGITVEDLHDPSITILIAFHPKILNKTQRKWHILEKEIYVHIHLHRKTHQLVNRCILPYGLRTPAIPKMLYVGDNKSALRIRMGLELPDSRCEYLTAKYQRAVGWAEEVAFTKHWPSTSLHMPGDSNNLADMSCRFAAMFADRLINPLTIATAPDSEDDEAEFDSFPLTEPVCLASSLGVYFEVPPPSCALPVTTRSKGTDTNARTATLANGTEPQSHHHTTGSTFGTCTNPPSGYTMHIFPLTSPQWIELSGSYAKDASEYNSVSLYDIFAVATETYSGSKIISKRVGSWLGSVFFLVNISTGFQSTVPVLFTPSATTKPALNIGTDYTTRLVMVIPRSSTLKLSSRTIDQEYFDSDHEEWAQQNKTYHDVLWLSHDKFTPHNSQATTLSNAKRMAWWPGLESDVQRHIKWCMLCSAQHLRLAPIGIGTRCLFPLLCWQIDDKIITDENIIKNTGYVSILVCYELTSGITVLACRRTAEAWEVSHIIHTRVVQYYGVPLQILSDHAPAYIKEVGLTLCSIQGIPSRITCSKSSHAKGGESAIRAVSKMIETASAKGDLRSPIHLELYTANLQIKICQITESDCSTAYERLFGFTPTTTADLLQAPYLTEAQLLKAVSNTKNAANADYLKALHDRAAELISYRNEMSDTRAKYNWADRLAKSANKQQPSLEYSIDDEVSVDGSRWQVQRICTLANGTPEKALLINSKGQCQWVRHDVILPLSVPVPQPLLPVPTSIAPGSTIFYYDSSSLPRTRILCGDIQTIVNDTITIHVRQPNDTVRTYLPRWTDPAHTDRIYRHNFGKQKSHLIPFIDTTTRSDVICTTKLSEGSMLDDETIYYLQSKGVDISIAGDQPPDDD